MKQMLFGFLLGLACVSWAVTPHTDGSVTYERGELETLRLQFANMKSIIENCSIAVYILQEENKALREQVKDYEKGSS
jgi:uncharacterized protein involved in tellurium resistance